MKSTRPYSLTLLLALCLVGLALLKPAPSQPATSPIAADPAAGLPSSTKDAIFTRGGSVSLASNPLSRSITPSPATSLITAEATPAPAPLAIQKSLRNSRGDTKLADRIVTKDGRVFPIRNYETLITPNDPAANQWWNTPNGMPQVWDMPFGARKTMIAVIDTGFALNHQEFTGRWATNTEETAGNGIDDDNNGYVDDVLSWDFANNDASVQAGQNNPDGTGTTHGTKVAGVAAATGNNNAGIAGINWHSSILPIQALDDNSLGNTFTVASAVYYAADRGADVINISLGTSQPDQYMREAIQYAIGKGSVVVAASGNDGCDCIVYPANYPEVIAVGASNSSGAVASFSSYGANLDIIAPGEGMAAPTWSKTNGSAAYSSYVSGTSFSAPFVSGLLGLARNYQPNATWPEISGAMFEQANRSGLTAASPRNSKIGFGVARANSMLERLRTPRNVTMRYAFSPVMADSSRAYQCDSGAPATLFYELSNTTQLRYTVSPLSRDSGVQQGLAARNAGYVCMALPTDTTSILRIINLAAETKNQVFIKQ